MPKNAEVLEALDKIEAGDLTIAAYRESLTASHKGRSPLLEYENVQKRMNELAPTLKKLSEYSLSKAVRDSFMLEGVRSQEAAQIQNLIKKGVLKMPVLAAPPENKEEAVV